MSNTKVIGITSCKGGVGKSSIAVNLAICLSSFYHKKVGLFDADLYGPNHSSMLGMSEKFKLNSEFIPVKKYSLESLSAGYFVSEFSSFLLRGPVLSNTLMHLYNNAKWLDLDFLIIDFPPGTGDTYLSMMRDVNFYGVFLVIIPNLVSIKDVVRSISMFDKFNINILALLENMSYYNCFSCDSVSNIYGETNRLNFFLKNFYYFSFLKLPFLKPVGFLSDIGVPFFFHKNFQYYFLKQFKGMCSLIL